MPLLLALFPPEIESAPIKLVTIQRDKQAVSNAALSREEFVLMSLVVTARIDAIRPTPNVDRGSSAIEQVVRRWLALLASLMELELAYAERGKLLHTPPSRR